jgi:hypothetical protein
VQVKIHKLMPLSLIHLILKLLKQHGLHMENLFQPEEAVLKGRSMYTWYKATKKFKLVRKGKEYIVKPGDSVGVRAAGSAKDKMRLVLDSLGVNKVTEYRTQIVKSSRNLLLQRTILKALAATLLS